MLIRSRRLRPALILLLLTLLLGSAAGAPGVRAQGSSSCPRTRAPQPGRDYDPRYVLISFTNACGQPAPLAVDIAATDPMRELGLMNITQLPPDQGELFVFDDLANGNEVRISFWMQDTHVPLSIAFIGKDGTVHEIQDMEPETLDLHTPAAPYLYAVEANQGWFAAHDIQPGSTVDFSAALALITPPSGS